MAAEIASCNIAAIVPVAYRDRLVEIARENDRSLSGEVRVAVRRYLETLPAESKQTPTEGVGE